MTPEILALIEAAKGIAAMWDAPVSMGMHEWVLTNNERAKALRAALIPFLVVKP